MEKSLRPFRTKPLGKAPAQETCAIKSELELAHFFYVWLDPVWIKSKGVDHQQSQTEVGEVNHQHNANVQQDHREPDPRS